MLNKKSDKISNVVTKLKLEAQKKRAKDLGIDDSVWPIVDYGDGFREVADKSWRNPECYLSTDSEEADRKNQGLLPLKSEEFYKRNKRG